MVILSKDDENFPDAFRAIGEDFPDKIYCLGNISLLQRKGMVAIIGTREADKVGVELSHELGVRFSSNVVVSGLARGIDTAVHWGCVDAEEHTIAIVGSGLDVYYPKENASLQQKILETGGLIVSEQPLGTKASSQTLISRLRLQMALADKVIVVECEKESGTMRAVNFAIKYNKPIYAVDNAWSGNRYLLENKIAKVLPPEPEYMTVDELRKRLKADIIKIYRET